MYTDRPTNQDIDTCTAKQIGKNTVDNLNKNKNQLPEQKRNKETQVHEEITKAQTQTAQNIRRKPSEENIRRF